MLHEYLLLKIQAVLTRVASRDGVQLLCCVPAGSLQKDLSGFLECVLTLTMITGQPQCIVHLRYGSFCFIGSRGRDTRHRQESIILKICNLIFLSRARKDEMVAGFP